MLKIRRLHIANAGWTEAAFDNETLDLRNPEGKPEACVLHAENGTGKTTVLGLLFNVLVPSEARFLPHLIKPDYKFTDYFQKGLSVIAVEWHAVNGRHPVTLQFIVPQVKNGEPQVWRRGALFRSGAGLDLDDLPLKGFSGKTGKPLRDRDGVLGWLREMEARYGDSHGFVSTANQAQWRTRLETIGIDTELANSQIQFNRQEGGIDAFLKISDERTFVSRFLALCLVTEAGQNGDGEPVCLQVGAAAERLRGLDELMDKQDLLRAVLASYTDFKHAAADWRSAREAERKAVFEAEAVRRAVAERIEHLHRQAEEIQGELAQLASRKGEEKSKRADAQAAVLACRSCLADLAWDEARALLANAEERRDRAVVLEKRLGAARDRRQIIALKAGIEELEASLAAAEREIEDPKRRAQDAGTALRAVLDREARASDHKAGAADGEARRQDERARAAYEQAEALRNEAGRLNREDAELETELRSASSALKRLQADVLKPTEVPAAAKARLERAVAEISAGIADAERRSQDAQQRYDVAIKAEADAQSLRQTALNEAKQLGEAIEEAETRRRGLMATPDWREHVGEGSAFDSDAAAKASAGARQLRNEARSRRTAAESYRREADRIASYKIAAVDGNVDDVMKAFAKAGIKSAVPAAQWLADVVDEETALRRFAETDPAGFAGIFIQNADEFGKIGRIDISALRLDRPVTIRMPHDAPRSDGNEDNVLIPAHGEAYDRSAAAAFVQSLGEKTGTLETEAEEDESVAANLEKLRADIASWLGQWGEGRLAALVERRKETGQQAESAAHAAAQSKRTATEAQEARARAETEARQARQERQRLEIARDKVVSWLEAFGSRVPQWESRRGEISRRLAELDGELAQRRREEHEAREAAERSRNTADAARRSAGDLRGERDSVDLYTGEEPTTLPDLETARTTWSVAYETWNRLREDRLGPLSGQLEEKKNAFSDAQKRFRSDHPDWADRANELDADAGRADLDQSHFDARQTARSMEGEVGEARGNLKTAQSAAQKAAREVERAGETAAAAKQNLAGVGLPDIRAAEGEARAAIAASEEALEQIATKEESLSGAEREAQATAQRLEDRARILPEPGMAPASLPDSVGAVIKAIDAAAAMVDEAKKQLERARAVIGGRYDALRREARAHPKAKLEQVLIDTLTGNEIEAAAEDAERLGSLLHDRIATIEQDIAKKDQDRNIAVRAMDGLLHRSLALFRSATERRVPETVPRFGGEPVLKMSFRPPAGDAGTEMRRGVAASILLDIVRSGEGPASDHELAANLVEGLVKAMRPQDPKPQLGLKLLKVNDQGKIHHLPVAEFKSSGGETLTSALLLYLLVARLRSQGRITSGGQIGGALVLDNPLGKASNNLFLKLQLALAQVMDVQLVFTTAIKDWSAVGEFPQVIKFRKETMDAATGRILVKVAKQWIGWPESAAATSSQEADTGRDERTAAE
ncbi:MAG: hypothetical protein ACLFV8_00880 [Alphaproteobacteria bacterium]